jgi:ubiquinone/menaquinone biosynthesis C-methylase UbiE
MHQAERSDHWDAAYAAKAEDEVSWYEPRPAVSLELIHATGAPREAPLIDVGGGCSRLVDALLEEGRSAVTVLDVSERAIAAAKARLGDRGAAVRWIVADVTTWTPPAAYQVWHDRAAFHFLTDPGDRAAYVERAMRCLPSGGDLIMATFAEDGPQRCSGLPVMRYDAAALAATLGPRFALLETRRHDHRTPAGHVQRFRFSRFRRL